MNAGAANVIVQGFLKGSFDVLDAMLSLSFAHDTLDTSDLSADDAPDLLTRHPVVLRGRIPDFGAVAILMTTVDASLLLALLEGDPSKAANTLEDADLASLKELGEPFLGGGVASVLEKFGRTTEQFEEFDVMVSGSDGASELLEYMVEPLTVCSFRFSAPPEMESTGVFLFSQSAEALVPEDLVSAVFGPDAVTPGSTLEEPQLSDAEMNDILSGFSPEVASDLPEEDEATIPFKKAPSNLDMILDIRLVATARLGRVNLTINEIMALGPGSIIEVGHLVDEPVELLINDKLIARGDVVVVDEKFGLRITEIVSAAERIESLR